MMNKKTVSALVAVMLGLGITACGGGGGGSPGSSSGAGSGGAVSGFSVPTEISAVPTLSSGVVVKPGLKSKLSAMQAATDPGTDYSHAATTRFVEERTLEQFDIIEQIMKALAQTKYADPANVNQGPYKAMIAWQDNQNGIETKTLEPWVVDSSMIAENGQSVNRVQVWVEEPDEMGGTRVVKAEFKIYASATQRSDGSYQDYGVWKLNVKFDNAGTSFFAADASIGPNGESILKLHENSIENNAPHVAKAILNKSDTQGFGQVLYPDWSNCMDPNCIPTPVTAKYVYDANNLGVQKGNDPVAYKDRNTVVEMTHRYGLFDSITGGDVLKTKSFGFPVQYTDENGVSRFAYYGAWQGRHQLWANGASVQPGTVVTRQDRGPNQSTETYTVSAPFVGTLTRRTLVAADINDLLNIPVETWVNMNFNLQYDGSQWVACKNPDFSVFPPTCGAGSAPFADFSSLAFNPNDHRKFIGINRWDNASRTNLDYVYDPNGPSGAGFYVATRDPNTGNLTPTTTLFSPVAGDQLWVNIGGSIYIMYAGTGATGWVQKTLLSFDQSTWTPVFDPAGDVDYTLPLDREYYINNSGANYVVKRTGPGVYDVKIELQTVANPVNAASFLDPNTRFMVQWAAWGDGVNSTYRFETSSSSPDFLKLVYNTVGSNDANLLNASGQPVQPGDVLAQGQWGLMAYVSGVSTGVQYNWEYPRQGETWGTLTYLIDSNNNFKLLDDPIRLNPMTLVNHGGVSKTLSLQYDGWMHGLADLYEELRKNDFVMTADISGKIINIPDGTVATDSIDPAKSYLIKPLEISQFLNVVADPGTLDMAVADTVDLSTVPNFVEHNMGPMPPVTGVKYSEGILVQ
ncbi:MAG: hypothetical protein HY204_12160 [Nitrospirae bacterium]|nr:hypothetical protein [Nitrospirota bacterium]